MTKVIVLYPKTAGSWFDFDYYLGTHMPMSAARIGSAIDAITVDRVTEPGPPYEAAPFHAICTFVCASREAFEQAFLPHMEELQNDTPNYTNSQQIVIVTEDEPI